MNLTSIEAFFFDMDGVLFDSMPRHARSWAAVMQKHNFPFQLRDAYLNEGRVGFSIIDEKFLETFGRHATEDEKQCIYKEKATLFEAEGKPEPIPDVRQVLEYIKSIKKQILVVTGSAQPSLINRLEGNFPHIFRKEKMITAFDVTRGKPDPEPYLKALERANVKANEAIVIENAPLGIMAAKAAHIFTIAINTGILSDSDLQQAGADLIFPNMRALLQWLQSSPN